MVKEVSVLVDIKLLIGGRIFVGRQGRQLGPEDRADQLLEELGPEGVQGGALALGLLGLQREGQLLAALQGLAHSRLQGLRRGQAGQGRQPRQGIFLQGRDFQLEMPVQVDQIDFDVLVHAREEQVELPQFLLAGLESGLQEAEGLVHNQIYLISTVS